MPELPEVETLKLGLQKYIVGKTIAAIDIQDSKLFEGNPKDAIDAKVSGVRRLAKGVLIDLSNNYTFAVHIKLTGQLIYRDSTNEDLPVQKPVPAKVPNQFTRVVIHFTDKTHLYFQEVRGFAWMKLLPTEELISIPFFKTLGPELIPSPGSHTALLTPEIFEQIVMKSNLPIKVLLMEQKKIGGIGNIYANDGLFDAGIDPRRRAKSLSTEEIKKLYDSLMKVLVKAMKYRGSSELNFVDVLGQLGEYQKHFLIYGKKGKACVRCGGVVQKEYLGGRGTFFCVGCQK
jgi:formamidopyrimidine-DNA glycosylase